MASDRLRRISKLVGDVGQGLPCCEAEAHVGMPEGMESRGGNAGLLAPTLPASQPSGVGGVNGQVKIAERSDCVGDQVNGALAARGLGAIRRDPSGLSPAALHLRLADVDDTAPDGSVGEGQRFGGPETCPEGQDAQGSLRLSQDFDDTQGLVEFHDLDLRRVVNGTTEDRGAGRHRINSADLRPVLDRSDGQVEDHPRVAARVASIEERTCEAGQLGGSDRAGRTASKEALGVAEHGPVAVNALRPHVPMSAVGDEGFTQFAEGGAALLAADANSKFRKHQTVGRFGLLSVTTKWLVRPLSADAVIRVPLARAVSPCVPLVSALLDHSRHDASRFSPLQRGRMVSGWGELIQSGETEGENSHD